MQTVCRETTVVSDKLWTVTEVARLPEGFRYEILEGVLYMAAMPLWPHGLVVDNIHYLLNTWVRSHKLGRVLGAQNGIYLNET